MRNIIIISMESAPVFLAGLIPTGVTFEARQISNHELEVTFTGGY